MARELAPPRRGAPDRSRYYPIKLDHTIGEPKWRAAAAMFMSAQEHLHRLTGAASSARVVPLCPFRKGSEKLLEEYGHRSQNVREAAVRVLFAPAPSPRELANKIKLLALAEGLADPTAWSRDGCLGWTSLEESLGQLFLDAVIIDQYHDPHRFTKHGKLRKGKR